MILIDHIEESFNLMMAIQIVKLAKDPIKKEDRYMNLLVVNQLS